MIAWLFIAPTILLLLAINIFPLIWSIQLSFTNFKANRAVQGIQNVGILNYINILHDPEIWSALQITAHFLFWTILLQVLLGFSLAWLSSQMPFEREKDRAHYLEGFRRAGLG